MSEKRKKNGTIPAGLFVFCVLSVLLCSLCASGSLTLYFLCLVPAVAGQAALLLLSLPTVLCALPVGVGVLLAGTVSRGLFAVLLVLLIAPAGYVLARCVRRGENRASAISCLSAVMLTGTLLSLLLLLYTVARDAGSADMFAYLRGQLDALADEMCDRMMQSYRTTAALYEKLGKSYEMPAEADVKTLVLRGMSVLPAIGLLSLFFLSLATTYVLDLLAVILRGRSLGRMAAYRVSPVYAGAFLCLLPAAVLWQDFSSPFYLSVLNGAIVLAPVLALGAVYALPRIFGWVRRLSRRPFDFVLFLALLVLFVLFYFAYVVLISAIVYAVFIIKNALSHREKDS